MNGKQALLSAILVMFTVASGWVVLTFGLDGVLTLMTANGVAWLLTADLTIALSLVSVWMWNDARDRGISPLPYLLLTVAAGSAGPLLYLIRREGATPFGRATIAAPVR